MKTISFLLFIVVVTVTTTHAQSQRKSISAIKAQNSGSEKMLNPQPLPPKEDNTAKERSIIIVSGAPAKKGAKPGKRKDAKPTTFATKGKDRTIK